MALKDELNLKIIKYLQKNGRDSYSNIAKQLGVSESTVRKRINKLVKNGIIERFTIVLNPEFTEKSVIAFLTIVPLQSNTKIKELTEKIVSFPEVAEAFYMSGKCGILAKVMVKNLKKLDELITKIRNLSGINEIESCIVLRELKKEL
ncbi:MAG: Lrp/AsnC family transcriptional regulator [Candidatus Helarchaeota archaeon]